MTFARIVSRYGEKLIGHDATLRIARDARVWFFRRALPLAPGRLSATRTGDLLARLMSDIGEVDGVSVRALAPLSALLGVWCAGVMAAAVIYPPAAALLVVLGLLIGVLVPWQVARGGAARELRRTQQRAALRTQAFEGLEGAADLAAVEAQGTWITRIDTAATALAQGDRSQRRHLIGGNLLHALCGGIGLAGMLWLALDAAERDLIDAAMAAGLVFLTMALLEVWAGAGLALQALQSARVAGQRLQAIVDQAPSVQDPLQPIAVPPSGVLELRQVRFAWPGPHGRCCRRWTCGWARASASPSAAIAAAARARCRPCCCGYGTRRTGRWTTPASRCVRSRRRSGTNASPGCRRTRRCLPARCARTWPSAMLLPAMPRYGPCSIRCACATGPPPRTAWRPGWAKTAPRFRLARPAGSLWHARCCAMRRSCCWTNPPTAWMWIPQMRC